ncbi:hypothetical protein [Dongia sp.]|uniref:hypothetical protein n=1 Tax=Dongia sp. TaxID=1977262 RepID=UPI0035B4DE7E
MNDQDFLAALEDCTLPPADFSHAAHIRAGFLYLRHGDFAEALGAMRRAIKTFAASIGKEGLYHETITVAFMTLINERMAADPSLSDWPAFAARNGDLFAGDILCRFYSRERLEDPLARRVFLLPDRAPQTSCPGTSYAAA